MGFVFVSHANADKPAILASGLLHALVRSGVKIWIDTPEKLGSEIADHPMVEGIQAREKWHDQILTKAHDASAIIVVWSNQYVRRLKDYSGRGEHIHKEITRGITPRFKLINVLLEEIDEDIFPYFNSTLTNFQIHQGGSGASGGTGIRLNEDQMIDFSQPAFRAPSAKSLVKSSRDLLQQNRSLAGYPSDKKAPLIWMLDRRSQEMYLESVEFTRGALVGMVGGTQDSARYFAERIANVSFSLPLEGTGRDAVAYHLKSFDGSAERSQWKVCALGLDEQMPRKPDRVFEFIVRAIFRQWNLKLPLKLPDDDELVTLLSNRLGARGVKPVWYADFPLRRISVSTGLQTCQRLDRLWGQLPAAAGIILAHLNTGSKMDSYFLGGKNAVRKQAEKRGLVVLPELRRVAYGDLDDWIDIVMSVLDVDRSRVEDALAPRFAKKRRYMAEIAREVQDDLIDELWANRT